MRNLKLLAFALVSVLSISGVKDDSLQKNSDLTAFQKEPLKTDFVMTTMSPKSASYLSSRRDAWIAAIGELYAGSYHDVDDKLIILTTDSDKAWQITNQKDPYPYEPWTYLGPGVEYSYHQLEKGVEQLKANKEAYGVADCGIDERENTLYVILQYVETENEWNQMKQKIDQAIGIKNIRYTKNGKLRREIKPGDETPDLYKILEALRYELIEERDMREIERTSVSEYDNSMYIVLRCPSKAFHNFLENYEYRDYVQVRVDTGPTPLLT